MINYLEILIEIVFIVNQRVMSFKEKNLPVAKQCQEIRRVKIHNLRITILH